METFKSLFSLMQQTLIIPNYQRGYVWTSETGEKPGPVTVFWEDLINYCEDKSTSHSNSEYLFGSVIVHNNNLQYYLIDGQQRLTTCNILLIVANEIADILYIQNLNKDGVGAFKKITSKIYTATGIGDLQQDLKLQVANCNKEFFFNKIVSTTENEKIEKEKKQKKEKKEKKKDGNVIKVATPEAHINMSKAKSFFYDKLWDYIRIDTYNDPSLQIIKLKTVIETLLDSFQLVYIEKTSLADAHKIFETINSRGKPLSQADLVKNYAFTIFDRECSKTGFDIEKTWEEISHGLKTAEFTQYLRYFWVSRNGVVSEPYLFKSICKKITTPDQMEELCNSLKEYKEIYKFMTSEGGEINLEDDLRNILIEIRILRVEIHSTIVFAMLQQKFTVTQMVNILKLLEVYLIRNNIINSASTNDIWKLIANAAKDICSGIADYDATYESIYNKLAGVGDSLPMLVGDDIVISKLTSMTFTNNDSPKVILKLLEPNYGKINLEHVSLEHILPENPNFEVSWKEFSDKATFKSYCYRIGNMALISLNENIKVSNKDYNTKRESYKTFDEKMVRDIAEEYPEWTKDTIDKRTKDIAKHIADYWQLPNRSPQDKLLGPSN